MLNDRIRTILDRELIGFLTAVNESGQPQAAPVWFVRDGDDIIVYNKSDTPRFAAIAANPKVSFTLRGDPKARGALTMEATAAKAEGLPPANDYPEYMEKYRGEIGELGWTPDSFSADYDTPLRIMVTRVRSWGLETLE